MQRSKTEKKQRRFQVKGKDFTRYVTTPSVLFLFVALIYLLTRGLIL